MMSVKRAAFWMGIIVGAGIGYVVGIMMPEEKQKHLREELIKRGEDVVSKARVVSEERARQLAEEAKRRAEEVAAQVKEHIPDTLPFSHAKSNGAVE